MRTVAEKLAGQAAVAQVNTEENPSLATRFGVEGIPLILLFTQGRAIGRLPGAHPEEAVLSWFRQHRSLFT